MRDSAGWQWKNVQRNEDSRLGRERDQKELGHTISLRLIECTLPTTPTMQVNDVYSVSLSLSLSHTHTRTPD